MTSERYGEEHSPNGGRIVWLADEGAAFAAGMRVGDAVRAVDGKPVRDILDWQWLSDADEFTVTVERGDELLDVEVTRVPGEPLGIEFEDAVFDGVMECVNSCAFCFVAQLPPGLRPALSVRDDDYRLSFLYGNFVTLTNLEEPDVDRILEQRLSPLYVSLHAVDSSVRAQLVCPTVEDTTLERIDTLLGGGIELHIQIVLVPGINDGDVLAETLSWLASREGIVSVGIVPLGFTAHQSRFSRSFTPAEAADLIASIAPLQTSMRGARDSSWVYAADEFYLNAGEVLPDDASYDDYPQYENGIGLVRSFIDEFAEASDGLAAAEHAFVALTGTLFAPVLQRVISEAGLARIVRVVAVENRLFGGNVSVTGLLGGHDIIEAVRADGGVGIYLLPDVVVNSDGLLLDDVPADELSVRAGADLRVIGSDAASLVAALATAG